MEARARVRTCFRRKFGILEPSWQNPRHRTERRLETRDDRNIVQEKGFVSCQDRRHRRNVREQGAGNCLGTFAPVVRQRTGRMSCGVNGHGLSPVITLDPVAPVSPANHEPFPRSAEWPQVKLQGQNTFFCCRRASDNLCVGSGKPLS